MDKLDYEKQILSLEAEICHLQEELQDFEKLKLKYLKLLMFMDLTDEEQQAVLNSDSVASALVDLLGSKGINLNISKVMAGTHDYLSDKLTLKELLYESYDK
jgi:predicted  nucleic acid-binding Zn-ribbon protein